MKWESVKVGQTVEPHSIRSDCGRFYIARVYAAGMPYFELWRAGRKEGEVFEYSDQDLDAVKQYAKLHENGDGV